MRQRAAVECASAPICKAHCALNIADGAVRRREEEVVKKIVDDEGDRWPYTGRTCSVCSWPLHRALTDESTHPGCEPAPIPAPNQPTTRRRTP